MEIVIKLTGYLEFPWTFQVKPREIKTDHKNVPYLYTSMTTPSVTLTLGTPKTSKTDDANSDISEDIINDFLPDNNIADAAVTEN